MALSAFASKDAGSYPSTDSTMERTHPAPGSKLFLDSKAARLKSLHERPLNPARAFLRPSGESDERTAISGASAQSISVFSGEASSRTQWKLVPPKPNALTPALLG